MNAIKNLLQNYGRSEEKEKEKTCCDQDSNLGCHGHNVKY